MRSSTPRPIVQVGGAAVAVTICALIKASLGVPILPFLFFFPAIMLSSFFFGRLGGLFSVVASTLVAVYFFIPPVFSFAIHDIGLGIGVVVFFAVACSVALMISLLREYADKLEREVAAAVAEVERTHEALRQSARMEAIGQLTGGVAHDFNNLLTVIRSSADLLRRPSLAEDRRLRYLEAIASTADRAIKLTGQLLVFARRQELKPETFDAGASVEAVVEMIRTLTGPRIQIVVDAPAKACFVSADRSQFDTALINLAVNARDAMGEGGRIEIVLQAVESMPAIRTSPPEVAPFVAISLADTGSGIAPDHLQLIFEPFFTTKEIGKGTGLGLSQVFGFAKQSGGEIAVASTLGEGSTFTLYLPRVAAAARPDAAIATTPRDTPAPLAHPLRRGS